MGARAVLAPRAGDARGAEDERERYQTKRVGVGHCRESQVKSATRAAAMAACVGADVVGSRAD